MLLKIRPGGWLICLCAPTSWLHASNLLTHTLLPPFIPPQVRVDISAACRGDLSVSLESPSGTVSLLLDTRPNDASTAGLKNWTLMTVHCWEEQPRGLWTLRVREEHSSPLRLFLVVYISSSSSSSSIGIKHRWVLFQTAHFAALDGLNDGKYEAGTLLPAHGGRLRVRFWLELGWMFSPCVPGVPAGPPASSSSQNKNMHISLIGDCKLPPG